MLIRTSRSFVGPNRERLEEMQLVDCENLQPINEDEAVKIGEPQYLFFGTAMIQGMALDENGQPVPLPPQELTFPIDAKSRKEAFASFEKSARDYLTYLKEEEEREAQRMKSSVYIPNAAEVNQISHSLKFSE